MKKKTPALNPTVAELLERLQAGPTPSEALEWIRADPALLKHYKAAVKVLDRYSSEALRAHVELGRIGHMLRYNSHGFSRLSSRFDAVQLVAFALGMHCRMFWYAISTIECFTGGQIASFFKRRCSAGFLITPGHLRIIAPLAAHQRHELIESFYEHSLTIAELADEIDLTFRPPRRSSRRARTLTAAIRQTRNMAKAFRERLDCSPDDVVHEKLRELINGERDPAPDELERLTALQVDLEALQLRVAGASENIKEAITVLKERRGSSA